MAYPSLSNKSWQERGQSLVELLLAVAVAAVVLPGLATGLVASREGKAQQQQRQDATWLVREAQEAVRVVRERSWSEVAVSGAYHPVSQNGTWVLAAGAENLGGLTRSITIADVFRNANGQILETGGSIDPSTKKITATVGWSTPTSNVNSTTFYLTRFLGNRTWIQTTTSDFAGGTLTNTTVTNENGGEVQLAAGGRANWCEPNLSLATVDLPKQGVANAISAVESHASVGTGENASGVSYAAVSISNSDPPTASVSGTFDGYKTNDIWTDGQYTYLATDNNAKEVVILDVSKTPYQEIGSFDTPGPTDASSVFVSGNRGYVTAGWWLHIFDITTKTGTRPRVGTPFFLIGNGTSIVVKDQYAYVSVSNSPIEMQIIDISNPWYLFTIGWGDVNGQDGRRVFINDSATRAYLVTNASASRPEFFIIDVSNKSGYRPVISSYEAGGMNPQSLVVVPGNRAIIVGTGGEEYQVLNISSETSPTRCGGLNIDTTVKGIAAVMETDGDAYAYIITGDANAEFKIIEGGPGGRFAQNGTFESSTLDEGSAVAFNRFNVSFSEPVTSEITFQVAGTDPVAGSCNDASFTFVGPDGTSNTYFGDDATIPFSDDGVGFENPAQCFRYRASLSATDPNQTPIFSDITVNYSP